MCKEQQQQQQQQPKVKILLSNAKNSQWLNEGQKELKFLQHMQNLNPLTVQNLT